jgi:hypothetical protein
LLSPSIQSPLRGRGTLFNASRVVNGAADRFRARTDVRASLGIPCASITLSLRLKTVTGGRDTRIPFAGHPLLAAIEGSLALLAIMAILAGSVSQIPDAAPHTAVVTSPHLAWSSSLASEDDHDTRTDWKEAPIYGRFRQNNGHKGGFGTDRLRCL